MSIFDQPSDPAVMDLYDLAKRGHWIVSKYTKWVSFLVLGLVGFPLLVADKLPIWAAVVGWLFVHYLCWAYAISEWRKWAVQKGWQIDAVNETAEESGLVPGPDTWLRYFDLSRER